MLMMEKKMNYKLIHPYWKYIKHKEIEKQETSSSLYLVEPRQNKEKKERNQQNSCSQEPSSFLLIFAIGEKMKKIC